MACCRGCRRGRRCCWKRGRPASAIDGPLRRFNQAIAARGSIHANTIPSGHAAGAFACALAIGDALPVAGAVFAALAVSIATASVLGRYHYAGGRRARLCRGDHRLADV